jgi:hypothetical protein
MVFKEVGTSSSKKESKSRSVVVNDVGDDDDYNHVGFLVVATVRI